MVFLPALQAASAILCLYHRTPFDTVKPIPAWLVVMVREIFGAGVS
jgi:hypothetical protein